MDFGVLFLLCFVVLGLFIWWLIHDYLKTEGKRAEKGNNIDLYFQNAKNNGINLDIISGVNNSFIGIDKNSKKKIFK